MDKAFAWSRATPRRGGCAGRRRSRSTKRLSSIWVSCHLYGNGEGVKQEYSKARESYEKVAKQGSGICNCSVQSGDHLREWP